MSELQQGAVEVAKILNDAGYEVFYAGGSVRDLLLGLEPKDFDLVTSAKPEEIDALFRRTVLVGANFGVVRVLWSKRREYEVATYRREGKYTDGRRPDEVIYSDSKEEDVQRRDFTINALLMDPFTQEIFDFVSGEDDLSKRRIRAVGHAETRFQEDRLRLLRAIRFAARFNFEIENETYESICRNAQ
ncbi:MAG: CCA tRNA nucleotidyltransferase, partial [Myxococcota bacterium]|nr:CCA tRNA nucleotidyltransferase [Myxococcota bacterium]